MNIEEIQKHILSGCNDCNGTFYETKMGDDGQVTIDNCKCFQKLLNYVKYDKAGIGQDWWQFELSDIEEDFDKKVLKDVMVFLNNIKACVINKVQLFFYGKHGRGKTTMATLLLKSILKEGHTAQLIKARHIIDKLYSGQIDDLYKLDFLVVDEFDKINGTGNYLQDFSATLTDLMDNIGIIMISNKGVDELNYPEFLMDRLKSIKLIEFKGKNYRSSFQSKFDLIKKEAEK